MKSRKEILNGIKRLQRQESYWRNKPYDTIDQRTEYREKASFREGMSKGLKWVLQQ